MKQCTFAIIKPDAVRKGATGHILSMAADAYLYPVEMLMMECRHEFWQAFYAEHEGKPFFDGLVAFMSSGPCVFVMLEGMSVIERWRELMGATDPSKAECWTIRGKFGTTGPANAVHGSDSLESALREARFFSQKAARFYVWGRSPNE